MSDEEKFEVVIEDAITVREAAQIAGIVESRVRQLCREYQETQGDSGLKSKKWGHYWQVERLVAERYERTTRGPKPARFDKLLNSGI